MGIAAMPPTWKVFAMQDQKAEEKTARRTEQEICESLPWTIIVVDRAGYQKSTLDKKPADWTYDDAVLDFVAVLDDMSASKVAVYAQSSGG